MSTPQDVKVVLDEVAIMLETPMTNYSVTGLIPTAITTTAMGSVTDIELDSLEYVNRYTPIEWRIRNLPTPVENYIATLDNYASGNTQAEVLDHLLYAIGMI